MKAFRIIKRICKILGLVLVFGTTVLILWRIFTSGDPQAVKTMLADDTVKTAYAENGEDLTAYWQKLDNITRGNHNYGYFCVTRGLFIEEANQVQVTFRYNNSTLRHLKEDYELETIPGRDEDVYDVSLVVVYDLTPDDTSDNSGTAEGYAPGAVNIVRYHPEKEPTLSHRHNVYNYRKYVFNGVDMTVTDTPVLSVYVDIYYKGDVDYEKDSYGTLIIYDYTLPKQEYALTAQDKKALK
jgi:hypothetical protein